MSNYQRPCQCHCQCHHGGSLPANPSGEAAATKWLRPETPLVRGPRNLHRHVQMLSAIDRPRRGNSHVCRMAEDIVHGSVLPKLSLACMHSAFVLGTLELIYSGCCYFSCGGFNASAAYLPSYSPSRHSVREVRRVRYKDGPEEPACGRYKTLPSLRIA